MNPSDRLSIVVVGDSFCPSSAMRAAFDAIADRHDVRFADVVDESGWTPVTESDRRIKEFMGTPMTVIGALDPPSRPDVLVVQGAPVTDAVLDACPTLRLVCCARGGPVNVDLQAASERGIPVVTTPGKNADGVAELAIAFAIMLARRLPEIGRYVDGGGIFAHDNYEGANWFGHDLAGHTLGLVGFGQIGRRVASRARAFGMDVLVSDPFIDPVEVSAAGCEATDLDGLLARSDFVSVHARAAAENRGMIGRPQIAAMRRGSYLINTARDMLIDEAAVIDGLASGHLAGAAFDVVSPSPASGRHPLLAFPNVIITTHIGGATYETLHHGSEMAVAEIERLLAGEPLKNVANRAGLASRAAAHGAA